MNPISVEQLMQDFPLDYLRELSTLGAISDDTVMNLLNEGRILQLAEGETLYHFGEKVKGFYVILSGEIDLYQNHLGSEVLIHQYQTGEQIGFVGMIALHDRMGSAIASSNTVVLELSAYQYFDLHLTASQDFGLLTLNLSREMARTIGNLGNCVAELRAENERLSAQEHH
ncbi:cyclic nucleotide-binding domain-containing protein [Marinobacterium jannaschii]|uniref:cyclic nucleotide-binding domain-containing protein n=1 Tax=Marinobacterium jannaschii TaxID=64970 RepID=UPI0004814FD6|nr:cyclic nucleotide-binding domain-containing protein [Marinobacterium jannaschii]